jgi:hypothetical protein
VRLHSRVLFDILEQTNFVIKKQELNANEFLFAEFTSPTLFQRVGHQKVQIPPNCLCSIDTPIHAYIQYSNERSSFLYIVYSITIN